VGVVGALGGDEDLQGKEGWKKGEGGEEEECLEEKK